MPTEHNAAAAARHELAAVVAAREALHKRTEAAVRSAHGVLSVTEIAELLGRSRPTIYAILDGRSPPA